MQDIFQTEMEYTEEKKPVQQVDWNTQRVVNGGAVESETQRRKGKMAVTGKLTNALLWLR